MRGRIGDVQECGRLLRLAASSFLPLDEPFAIASSPEVLSSFESNCRVSLTPKTRGSPV